MATNKEQPAAMALVVTYDLIYPPGAQVDLCDAHAATGEYDGTYLTRVSYGAHRGVCQACAEEDSR